MNNSRRNLIFGTAVSLAGLGLLAGTSRHAFAQMFDPSGLSTLSGTGKENDAASIAPSSAPLVVTVVEIANFQCSRCYAVNGQFDRIRQAADAAEVDIVFAPAAWEGQSLWPNRVYYSMRDLFIRTEPLARNALFQGIHEEGQLFETISQVRQYFERKGVLEKAQTLDSGFDWAQVAERADSNEPLYSEIKVGRLIDMSGIEEVPSFLWLGDARIADLVTPSAGDPGQIVAAVIRKLGAGVKK